MSEITKLKDVRLSFPDLFDAVQFDGQGPFRYNASFLVEPGSANDKAIQASILAAAQEAWPKNYAAVLESLKGNSNKYCYVKGDSKAYEGYAGMLVLSSHRKDDQGRPAIIDRNKAQLAKADGKPYAGCFVNANVEFWGQQGQYQGMRCTLIGVQFNRDGDAFSGGKAASPDDFDDLGEGSEADSLV